ncbi:hypothetical protein LX36DRAFT_153746 [Colletotrichum falcatum]|nr:hypothetical protein LX36DRAFT_153746 [Colletotrichum falcatum]
MWACCHSIFPCVRSTPSPPTSMFHFFAVRGPVNDTESLLPIDSRSSHLGGSTTSTSGIPGPEPARLHPTSTSLPSFLWGYVCRFAGNFAHTEAICKPLWELGAVLSPNPLPSPNLLAARTSARLLARLFPQLFSSITPVAVLSPSRSSPHLTGVRCRDPASRPHRPPRLG